MKKIKLSPVGENLSPKLALMNLEEDRILTDVQHMIHASDSLLHTKR